MRTQIDYIMKQAGVSLTDVADYYQKSKSSISTSLAGGYGQDKQLYWEDQVTLFCQGVIKTKGLQADSGFMSAGQGEMLKILRNAYESQVMNLITSNSGCGKTYIVEQFLKEHPYDVLYIRCHEVMSVLGVLEEIARKLGISSSGTATNRLARVTEELLDRKYKMIIADEVDLLLNEDTNAPKKIIHKISLFRNLFESGLGICLIGLSEMKESLKRAEQTYFNSRVFWSLEASLPTAAELSRFWIDILGMSANQPIITLAKSKGYFRFLKNQSRKIKYEMSQRTDHDQRQGEENGTADPFAGIDSGTKSGSVESKLETSSRKVAMG